MDSLENADIRIDAFDFEGDETSDSEDDETTATHLFSDDEINAIRLIQGICNVRSLTLVIDGLVSKLSIHVFFFLSTLYKNSRFSCAQIPPTSPFPMFDNLIEFNFYGRETWLVEFLYCAPNLKTLKFSFSLR
ncbi:hypothetical protein V6Z11_A02G009700 [Gossypium hirsutum]